MSGMAGDASNRCEFIEGRIASKCSVIRRVYVSDPINDPNGVCYLQPAQAQELLANDHVPNGVS